MTNELKEALNNIKLKDIPFEKYLELSYKKDKEIENKINNLKEFDQKTLKLIKKTKIKGEN